MMKNRAGETLVCAECGAFARDAKDSKRSGRHVLCDCGSGSWKWMTRPDPVDAGCTP